uniref:Uncharacterized protein n=1 Tax=viral metagenome TaxID=1070528 RepID=A0A6C0EAY1_9ZZZZ
MDPLFIFAFILMLLLFKLPNVEDDNYIRHKLGLFMGIFLFSFALQILKKLRSNCQMRTQKLLYNALKFATAGILGYSIFTDLVHMESTKGFFEDLEFSTKRKVLMISLIVSSFIALVEVTELVLLDDRNNCGTVTVNDKN